MNEVHKSQGDRRLETLLLEGVQSKAMPITPEFWKDLKTEATARLAEAKYRQEESQQEETLDHKTPSPPWRLYGSAVLLPQGWATLLALVHYEESPVSPYDELAIIKLTPKGPAVTTMWVTSEASVHEGRMNWGFPKELAPLVWSRDGQRITFRAGRRRWRIRVVGPALPVSVRLWTIQELNGCGVRIPIRIAGRLRLGFQGRKLGLVVESFRMTVEAPVTLAPK